MNTAIPGFPYPTGGRTIPGSLTLNLPEMWEVSGYNRVAPQWAIHYSMAYTSWSQFQELKATGSNGQTLFYKDESFKDSYRIALVQPTTTILTGPSVPVSPLMIARFRLRPVPSPSRIRTVSG
jgi:hypothetical protein